MSILNIRALTMNAHFYALILQSFLSGYDQPCSFKIIYTVLPVLMNKTLRVKLSRSNRKSNLNTVFETQVIMDNCRLSSSTLLTEYADNYDLLKPYCKEAIIILSSEKKLELKNYKINILEKIKYNKYSGNIKFWLKSAYYLGIVLSKSDEDEISDYLGVKQYEKLH